MRPTVLVLVTIGWLALARVSPLAAQVNGMRDSSQAYQPDAAVVTRALPPDYTGRLTEGAQGPPSTTASAAVPTGNTSSRLSQSDSAGAASGFRNSASHNDQAWTAGSATQRLESSQSPSSLPAAPAVPLPAIVRPASGSASVGSYVAQAQYTSPEPQAPNGRLEVSKQSVTRDPAMVGDSAAAAAADGAAQRPLKPPTSADLTSQTKRSSGTMQMLVSVVSSLLIVVGLLLGAAWCYRKAAPSINGSLPKQVVQVLGRAALAPRQQLVLLRFGPKLILVSNLQGEVRTVSEITDPLEVDRVAGMCESAQSGSISDSFRSVLHNIGRTG